MHLEYESLRRLGRFSLDDPEAGRKLIENLDRRRVRLQVIEMCWHFGYPFPGNEVRSRVKAFLDGLCAKGELVQPAGGLYCRPDMTQGRASVEQAVKELAEIHVKAKGALAALPSAPKRSIPKPERVRKPRSIKDTAKRDSEAKKLLAFALANGPNIRALSFAAEGQRLGMDRGRVTYILTHLRAKGLLKSNGYGTYGVTEVATAFAACPQPPPDDAS